MDMSCLAFVTLGTSGTSFGTSTTPFGTTGRSDLVSYGIQEFNITSNNWHAVLYLNVT